MSESLLSLETVMARVGFKRSKIYAMVQSGDFPKPIKLGSATRWPASAIDEWIAERVAAS